MNPNKKQYGILKYGGKEVAVRKTEFIAYKSSEIPMGQNLEGLPFKNIGQYILERKPQFNLEESLDEVRMMSSIEVGTHTFALGEEESPRIPTGEIYIVLKDGEEWETRKEKLEEELGLRQVKRTEKGFIATVTEKSPNPVKTAIQLQDLLFIDIAEPDFVEEVEKFSYGFNWDGKYLKEQWAFENKGGGQGRFPNPVYFKQGADCKGFEALRWIEENNIPLYDNVEVGVIDDAVDASFSGLNIVSQFSSRRQKNDTSPRLGIDKHGTAVCGTLGANNEILGVSPNAPIHFISLYVLSDNIIEQQFKKMEQAGVVAICCSWGASSSNYVLSTRKKEALKSCRLNGRGGKGTLIVFASGNGAYKYLAGFAENEHTLAIGACTSKDELSFYSNTSNENDSKGGKIFCVANSSIIPTVTCNVPGWTDETKTVANGYEGIKTEGGAVDTRYTNEFGGTSDAAPKVTGAAHLIGRINPNLTADQIEAIIAQSCDLIGGATGITPEFGHGKLNVLSAVKLAHQTTQKKEEELEEDQKDKEIIDGDQEGKDEGGDDQTGGDNKEDEEETENRPNPQQLVAYCQGFGQITDTNREQGVLHFWNSMPAGNYVAIITDINGDTFENPDFDVYVNRLGEMGLDYNEVRDHDFLPSRKKSEWAGTSTKEQEVLQMKGIEAGTYAFLVVSKDKTGPYKLIVRSI